MPIFLGLFLPKILLKISSPLGKITPALWNFSCFELTILGLHKWKEMYIAMIEMNINKELFLTLVIYIEEQILFQFTCKISNNISLSFGKAAKRQRHILAPSWNYFRCTGHECSITGHYWVIRNLPERQLPYTLINLNTNITVNH